jgi:hypothetical protein
VRRSDQPAALPQTAAPSAILPARVNKYNAVSDIVDSDDSEGYVPGRRDAVMRYTRYGECPPWYSVGKKPLERQPLFIRQNKKRLSSLSFSPCYHRHVQWNSDTTILIIYCAIFTHIISLAYITSALFHLRTLILAFLFNSCILQVGIARSS